MHHITTPKSIWHMPLFQISMPTVCTLQTHFQKIKRSQKYKQKSNLGTWALHSFHVCAANCSLISNSSQFSVFVNLSNSLCFLNSIPMEGGSESQEQKDVYSVWGLPPEDWRPRLKKLMESLRSEFNGPEFEPHVTVVGAISLTETEARDKFNKACEGLKAYNAKVEKVDTGTFFYQCVYLLLHPAPEVVETSDHCCRHFGYNPGSPYMPHLSLLYGDLSEEEKKKAQDMAYILDDSIGSLNFQISRLALYKTDIEDKSLKSWEKVAESNLDPS